MALWATARVCKEEGKEEGKDEGKEGENVSKSSLFRAGNESKQTESKENSDGAKKQKGMIACPQGHSFSTFLAHENLKCAACEGTIEESSRETHCPSHRCKACNYFICSGCYSGRTDAEKIPHFHSMNHSSRVDEEKENDLLPSWSLRQDNEVVGFPTIDTSDPYINDEACGPIPGTDAESDIADIINLDMGVDLNARRVPASESVFGSTMTPKTGSF